ncbi:MAG: TonB family protein [Spirochaetaceae bacterium]|nr:TonB family protein [Spirochaetaceae bacterium]
MGLLLTLSVRTVVEQAAMADPGKPFALVNVAVREEPEEAVPASSPPKPVPLPESAPPQIPDIADVALAEHYLEQEEPAEEPENTEASSEEAAVSAEQTGPAASPGNAGASAGNAAQTTEYVRRNYNYIQRRIRDHLVYPAPARRAGIQGVTEIAFTIHEDGRVSTVAIQKSSGHAVLDEAAIETVLAAAPFPRPPAPARLAIPISFRLR